MTALFHISNQISDKGSFDYGCKVVRIVYMDNLKVAWTVEAVLMFDE